MISAQPAVWRIHRIGGAHPLMWDELRPFGPLSWMRWDPHPLPQAYHADFGVAYTAMDVATAVAEVFQATRIVRRTPDRALAGWIPTRPLSLLDLTKDWALRNGASASLHAADRVTCRGWAHAIVSTWKDLDGLFVPSTMTGEPMIVLFARSTSSIPTAPALWRTLDDPAIEPIIVSAARRLGWPIV